MKESNMIALLRAGFASMTDQRDALAQRCLELEDYIENHSAITADYIARLQRTLDERDALRAEVQRLQRECEALSASSREVL